MQDSGQKKSKKELQKFGITFSVVLLVWGCLLLWHKNQYYLIFYAAFPLCLVCAILSPGKLAPLEKTLMRVLILVMSTITHVMLTLMYYAVFTPIGFLSRIRGKHFLEEKIDPTIESYWIQKENKEFNPSDCERQF